MVSAATDICLSRKCDTRHAQLLGVLPDGNNVRSYGRTARERSGQCDERQKFHFDVRLTRLMVAVVIARPWIHVVTTLVRRAVTSNVMAPMALGVVAASVIRTAAMSAVVAMTALTAMSPIAAVAPGVHQSGQ
jgi:hypothetical protein